MNGYEAGYYRLWAIEPWQWKLTGLRLRKKVEIVCRFYSTKLQSELLCYELLLSHSRGTGTPAMSTDEWPRAADRTKMKSAKVSTEFASISPYLSNL
mgnify:CR=1 FL=1